MQARQRPMSGAIIGDEVNALKVYVTKRLQDSPDQALGLILG
jgi:hypothetical protein